MKIAFVGVHGAGKSTTAKALSEKLNIPFYEIEVVQELDVRKLDVIERELFFLSGFIHQFIKICSTSQTFILTNHPLSVLPYIDWFFI